MFGSLAISFVIRAAGIRTTLMIACGMWLLLGSLLALVPPFPLVWLSTFGITMSGGFVEVTASTLGEHLNSDAQTLSLLWGTSHLGAMCAPAM